MQCKVTFCRPLPLFPLLLLAIGQFSHLSYFTTFPGTRAACYPAIVAIRRNEVRRNEDGEYLEGVVDRNESWEPQKEIDDEEAIRSLANDAPGLKSITIWMAESVTIAAPEEISYLETSDVFDNVIVHDVASHHHHQPATKQEEVPYGGFLSLDEPVIGNNLHHELSLDMIEEIQSNSHLSTVTLSNANSDALPSRRRSISNNNDSNDIVRKASRDKPSTLPGEVDGDGTDDDGNTLSFHNVHFCFPSYPEQIILRGLDMNIKEGEVLALVGPNRHGKNAVIQLIEQFYNPTHGCVKYNGVDLRELNVHWYRNQLAWVGQEPILFDDASLGENIRFGSSEATATQEDVEAAARAANVHDFITTLPDGYNTNVGSFSSNRLSRGQKQQIVIARALLRKPKVKTNKVPARRQYLSLVFVYVELSLANSSCLALHLDLLSCGHEGSTCRRSRFCQPGWHLG